MSVACCIPIVECVSCLACVRWVWKKFLYTAGRESENWGLATASEFEPVPRFCRYILSVYEDDLRNPLWAPPGGLGQTKYDGGYVHNGLLKAAQYVLEEECEIIRELLERNPDYMLTFAGHSLGAGVVTLLTMLAVKNREKLGNIKRKRIRCFAIAPTRCISLNLAVRYADIINSVVLQDDFLPRTTVALEDVFKSLFCFPCLMCIMCLKDTCTLEEKMLQDPRRLYAPGRLYHIIVRKPFRFKKISPVVKTAVPVDGRFEHLVLSCNLTSDHAIIWILKESQRAFDTLLESEQVMDIPVAQRMERQKSLAKEHKEEHRAAIERAIALDVPLAYPPSYGTFQEMEKGENSTRTHHFSF
ncbi:uncharacterized protein LOC111385613 isoform X3 [Olea europaea var. sylvestris]|uniref:uncharacterized protein LOC111385613 isoform X3 n=1 Tax=Olea europaea var. sylvestris TaxID=158386 RepID=UPI000C1D5B2F|nr:uncharacterized protein LOC111385613 isoform X3 [Olea europaea var. sylvestris]